MPGRSSPGSIRSSRNHRGAPLGSGCDRQRSFTVPPADLTPAAALRLRTDIVVIGAGQAGLSAAYHLKQLGIAPVRGFVVLDASPSAGGAWQFRWPSLTLS